MSFRVRLLGDGWFPDRPTGLNRYVRSLLEALVLEGVAADAVVLGPATDVSANVLVAADDSTPLRGRIAAMGLRALSDTDVIDTHFALYALRPALSRSGRRIPLVVHFHGPWSAESRAGGETSALAIWLKGRIERLVYSRAREVVVLSGAFKRLLVERYRVAPWIVTVIPPGVDMLRFAPSDRYRARERLGLPQDAWIVVSVRRLVPRMGLDVLLRAWAEARIVSGLLVIGGEGPERERLEVLAERLGLSDSVRFAGRLGEPDLPDLYRSADISVIPSVSLEGFGLVALESLACATPVLVSDTGGLPEAVADLAADLVTPAGDTLALARRLVEAHAGNVPSGAECRDFARRYSWDRVAREHVGIYRRALRSGEEGRRRVVYLTHTARLSGAELSLLRLLPTLKSNDIDPHVILAEDGPLASRLLQAGVSVELLPMNERARGVDRDAIGWRTVPGTATYIVRLARRLRQLRPDVVHTSSLKAGVYGSVAARLARVPVVWHVHDRIAEGYLPARTARIVRTLIRVLPTAVIANSQATLKTLPARGRTFVVPYAVFAQPQRSPVAAHPKPLRIGMVGRIAPWKGQHLFVAAFARAFPNGDEIALIIGAPLFGGAEDEYLEMVRTLGDQLGLGNRLVFTGFREDIAAELAQLDVLVHASVEPEPFGQVIIEGMAAGLPVIASAAGGPLELIDDGVDGLLYPAGDSEALALALDRVASDEALRHRLGEAGWAKTSQFAPERIAAAVMEVYREVEGTVPRLRRHDQQMRGRSEI